MRKERIKEIRERCEKATKNLIAGNDHLDSGSYDLIDEGPKGHKDNVHVAYFPKRMPYRAKGNKNVQNDFQFHHHAVKDLADALDYIEKLEKDVELLRFEYLGVGNVAPGNSLLSFKTKGQASGHCITHGNFAMGWTGDTSPIVHCGLCLRERADKLEKERDEAVKVAKENRKVLVIVSDYFEGEHDPDHPSNKAIYKALQLKIPGVS